MLPMNLLILAKQFCPCNRILLKQVPKQLMIHLELGTSISTISSKLFHGLDEVPSLVRVVRPCDTENFIGIQLREEISRFAGVWMVDIVFLLLLVSATNNIPRIVQLNLSNVGRLADVIV